MPQVSANVNSAILKEWFKKEGEAVAVNDPLGGIETDKALIDFDSEHTGIMTKILVPAGSDVEVGVPIAVISEVGESAADVAAFLAKLGSDEGTLGQQAQSCRYVTAPVASGKVIVEGTASRVVDGLTQGSGFPIAASGPADHESVQNSKRILASPLARRLAKNAGIDLSVLNGSGPGGRIVKRDIEQASAHPVGEAPRNIAAYIDLPHSSIRRTIARRLSESKATIPHFYVKLECRMQKLIELRAEVNLVAPKRVSLNDFIVKAVALALKEVPAMNVSWNEAYLRQYAESDISVAVSTDTGLITPIVCAAQNKSIASISSEVADLAVRARSGRLAPHEYQGGSFTISNLGMFEVSEFSAIINPPQAGILAVGAVQLCSVVINGDLAVAPVIRMVLSVDHRAVDGSVAAVFASALKRFIENPVSLLL
jgi:pyruvate dehydrogenase E2 component (dihydrolipoamide acetyltransferase)